MNSTSLALRTSYVVLALLGLTTSGCASLPRAGAPESAGLAEELNAEGEGFYYALQYASLEAGAGPALYARFVPSGTSEDVDSLRESFCAATGNAEACRAVSERADALVAERDLGLRAIGVAIATAFARVYTEEDTEEERRTPCPRPEPLPPGPLPPSLEEALLPTFVPNMAFGAGTIVLEEDEQLEVLELRADINEGASLTCSVETVGLYTDGSESGGRCGTPEELIAESTRLIRQRSVTRDNCPRTGCVCMPGGSAPDVR